MFIWEGKGMADRSQLIEVTGQDGPLGWIDKNMQPQDSDEVLISLPNGQAILASADLLEARADGSYYLPLKVAQFDSQRDQAAGQEEVMVIPLAAEEARISKKLVKNRVRFTKRVRERQEDIQDAGYREELDIRHVLVNEVVDEAPSVRQEGDTTIIPVLEEVLVIERRILLKEEVHVTRKRQPNEPQIITLRYEELEVERDREDNA
jgi:stress response protein YsnF